MTIVDQNCCQIPREAQAAYAQGDYRRAEELFRSLCRQQRHEPTWRLELSSVLITMIEFAAAERLLEEAIALSGGNSEVTRVAALAYFRMLRYEEAKRLLEPAAAAGNEESLLGLAQVLEREGRYDEAAEWVRRALKGRSPNQEFRYLEALVLSRQDKKEQAESRLRSLVEPSAVMPVQVRYKAAYLLAGILDSSKRYAEAAAVLGTAKQEVVAFPITKDLFKQQQIRVARFRDLAAKLRPEEIRRWREELAGDAPGFRAAALMGHPRSGTTLLEHRLERYENVVALDETNAFDGGALGAAGFNRDNQLAVFNPRSVERIRDARRRYAQAAATLHGVPLSPDGLVIDKNPAQLMQLALWLRVFPELRLLVALRDPRDVVISSYFLYLPPNPASVQFLDWERTARHYAQFMGLWLKMREVLPADGWLECRYEDMVASPDTETARVAAFLGIASKEKEAGNVSANGNEKEIAKPSATVHSPNYATATRPVHSRSVARWQHYAEHLKSSAKFLEPLLTKFGYEACH
jgi:tetratricopeptide (TPR) repeat protein